jgi:hypothetical protein
MAGESALANPPQTVGDLHKAFNFAQSDKNNESDIFLYLPTRIIDHRRQTNLKFRLLQQRWRWVEGTSYGGRKAGGRRNGTRGAEA